jgi:Flp pilus assembly protein TadG
MTHRSFRTPRRGVAAVEFALLSPFLVFLLIGLWEVGRMIEINQILSNAAREGARQAATGLDSSSQVQAVVTSYLQAAGVPNGNANVTVSGDPTTANQGDQLTVTVTMPFNDVRWIVLSLISSPSTTLTASATWTSLKDLPYPSSPSALPGS